ncbi:hypothetical protein BC829DRAFT_59339 [Chytridium lagenaria]|nr:hypothetical protein BC829DRAFT_59339 [Chytridium lagenaria]
MLLLDEKGWITHMSVLVIGHAHCGKTQLIHTFLTRSSSHLTSRFSNLTTCHTSELSSPVTFTNTPALTSTQTPATATNPESDVYLSPYCPTIEDGHTFQFILPPNPAYAAHYVPPPPPPPSAHVPEILSSS